MTRFKNIPRLIGSILFALSLAAAPVLRAAQLAADRAPVKTSCGCSCCAVAPESSEDSAMGRGACGCTVSNMEPATEPPLDLQPRSTNQTDANGATDLNRPDIEPVEPFERFSAKVDVPNEHSPPLYILHASYLI